MLAPETARAYFKQTWIICIRTMGAGARSCLQPGVGTPGAPGALASFPPPSVFWLPPSAFLVPRAELGKGAFDWESHPEGLILLL